MTSPAHSVTQHWRKAVGLASLALALLPWRGVAREVFDPFADASAHGGTMYSVGATLSGQTNAAGARWYAVNPGSSLLPPVLTNSSLSCPGFVPSTGNALVLRNVNGPGARLFLGATNSEFLHEDRPVTLYYSLLLKAEKIDMLDSVGTYNIGFSTFPSVGDQFSQGNIQGARLYLRRADATHFQVGIAKNSATVAWDSTLHSTNEVLLIVAQYEIVYDAANPLSTDDNVKLWVNPPVSTFGNAIPPAETVGILGSTADAGTISSFAILQRGTNSADQLILDELRVGTNWAFVTGGRADVYVVPSSVNLNYDATLQLNAVIAGPSLLNATLQWQRSGTNLLDDGRISGSSTTNLTVANVTAADAATYSLIASTATESVTNFATVSVNDPVIVTPPRSVAFDVATTVRLNVTAAGSPLLTYQWQFNGTNLTENAHVSGTTSNVLSIQNIQAADSGLYSVVVTGGAGSVTSAPAALIPFEAPEPPSGTPLSGGEYFWDVDPGQGNGTAVTFSTAETILFGDGVVPPFEAAIGPQPAGVHALGFRVKDVEERWGDVTWIPIELKDANALINGVVEWPPAETNQWLVAAEYFWDADPGEGLGTATSFPPGETLVLGDSLPPLIEDMSSLTPGVHRLGFRVRDASGRWAQATWVPVEVKDGSDLITEVLEWPPVETNQWLVTAEYFWDTDPGEGLGIATNLPPGETVVLGDLLPPLIADMSPLSPGLHRLGFRVRDASGRWAQAAWVPIEVKDGSELITQVLEWPPVETNQWLVSAEYFWDTDPGTNNGTAISFAPGETYTPDMITGPALNLPVPRLPLGLHQLGFRVRDARGNWSEVQWLGVVLDRKTDYTLATEISVLTRTNTNSLTITNRACPGPGQTCSNTFDLFVQTESVLNVFYTASPTACSDVRIHFFVDGVEVAASARLAAGASSGWFSLGPVTPGTHLLQLQAEGFHGDLCNIGVLTNWGGSVQVVTTSLATNVSGGEFTHTTNAANGIALGDFNNDDYADLFQTHAGQGGVLFVNNRKGGLNSTNLLTDPSTNALSAAWADVDNDGAPDLLLSGANPFNSPLLFRNLAGTNFALLTLSNSAVAITNAAAFAFADVDGDGFVDFVLGATNGARLELFRNLGDGSFVNLTESRNLISGGVRSVAFGDFNNDGRPDLVCAGSGGVRVFRNFGTNIFIQLIGTGLVSDGTSTSLAWADYDNDGWLDLFVGSSDHLGALFRNNQDFTFTQVQLATFNVPGFNAVSSVWEDFDQDGRLDLFVTSGATNFASRLFQNHPDAVFTVATNGPGACPAGEYAGSAAADLDRNGTPDLLVASRATTNLWFQNNGSGAGWLRVKLLGRPSNKSAIGARVKVLANIDGVSFWQTREISSGNGNQSEFPITFGLGDATQVDSLVITWPSGLETTYTNLPLNRAMTISELPDGQPVVTVNQTFHPSGQYNFVYLDPVTITIDSPFQDGFVFYTTDGSEPDFLANWYTGPFQISPPATIRAIAYDSTLSQQVFGDAAQLILVPTFFLTNSTPGGGDFSLTPPGPNYLSNTMVTAVATNWPGWTFVSWAGDLSGSNPTNSFVMDAHKDVVAVFGTTLTNTVLGGVAFGRVSNSPIADLYPYGSIVRLIALPAPTKYFVRWTLSGSNATNLTDNPMDWPMTNAEPSFIALFGNLPANTFSLTVLKEGVGTVSRSPAANFYTNGSQVTLTATPRFGEFFLGWTGDVTSPQNPIVVTMNSSKVITARFGLMPPLFAFGSSTYDVNETDGVVTLNVRNNGVPGTVDFATVNGSAIGGTGITSDFIPTNGTVAFAYGETNKTISVRINNRYLRAPDKTFSVYLANATGGSGAITNPAVASVTIHYNSPLNSSNSLLVQAAPAPVPDRSGTLRVTLVPPVPAVDGGFWRFPWELAWRPAGDVVSNLVEDYYPVEFRNVAGYQVASLPPQIVFTNAPATEVTNEYVAIGQTAVGRLTVQIGPNNPIVTTNAGWRLLGESVWRTPGSTATNVPPGNQVIEFKRVIGLAAPFSREVAVFGAQETLINAYYELPSQLPPGAALPTPLASLPYINDSFASSPRLPFTFNGQLQTDLGSGSGVAALSNVVLTAAHVVFNDTTLSYAGNVSWFFQKQTGELDPKPIAARGWYVLSGYAAARTNDLPPIGNLTPGESSPQSRNLDVAAVYFVSPVARGGFGGYLASDESVNEWLTSDQPKMLVGYPLDGTQFTYTNVVEGRMHSTPINNYAFTLQSGRVYATEGFLNFPGNSGGPLYVLCTNDVFYPAAVYLGTVGNASVVRAIDSDVVNLLNLAQLSATFGDTGTNFTSGGVIRIVSSTTSGTGVGYLQVRVGPPAAIAAGGGWRLAGDTNYSSNPSFTKTVTNGASFAIQFAPAAGWNLPADRTVTVPLNQVTIVDANYTVSPPLLLMLTNGVGIVATTNTAYRIEYRTNISTGAWLPLRSNTITRSGINVLIPAPLTNGPRAFYRAVWLP